MDNLQLSQGGSFAFVSGLLVAGTTAGLYKTVTNTIVYTVDGRLLSKAPTDDMGGTVVLPASYGVNTNGSFTGAVGGSTRLYGIYLNASGVASTVPGPIVNTAELAAGTAPLHFPAPIKGRCCIGVARVAVTAGNTFVPGTTAWATAGAFTVSFINLFSIPAEPILV